MPFAPSTRLSGGVGYDPHTNRVFVSQQSSDGSLPVIHVFEIQSTPDTTAPIISNVGAGNISDTRATITWTTDEPADSVVEYWETSTPGTVLTTATTNAVTSHSVPLSGLQPETSYGYRVISQDLSGNQTTSTDFSFTTLAEQPATSSGWNWDNPEPLPVMPAGAVQVANVSELINAVANLQSNQTISIQPGTYNLSGPLYVPQGINNWAIRGATGDRDDVVIQGNGMNGSVSFGFWIGNSPHGTLADLTIQNIREHGVIANPGAHDMLYHGLRMVDVGDQFIKSNPNGYGNGNHNGTVAYSIFEYTTHEQGAGATPDYTNGVDVHGGDNWNIHHNLFRNILHRPSGGIAGAAILMWNGSNNTVVDANTFINVARGISLGLYDNASGTDHQAGIIRNNFFYRDTGLSSDVDVPVMVADSPNTKVYHNTLISRGTYPNAIEYRFAATTETDIRNNLIDGAIQARDGANGTVAGNVENALLSLFQNPTAGDLHLLPNASVIDQAIALPDVAYDIDGQTRDANPDVGADEFQNTTPVNQPPVITDANFPVYENAANGAIVGQLQASDPNPNTTLAYSIVSGNTNGAFAISASGELSVANNTALQQNTSFQILVEVSDGEFTSRATVSVGVHDSSGLVVALGMDEATGSVTSDVSGQNNNGTISGASWTTGQFGSALSFDGINDRVDLGNVDVTDSFGFTASAWINIDNVLSINDARIVSKSIGSAEQSHYWMLSTFDQKLRFRLKTGDNPDYGTTTLIANNGNLQSNVWHYATATYDGNFMRLYLDGNEVGSIAKTGQIATSSAVPVSMGSNPSGYASWAGEIDELRIYNRALTPSEILADMDRSVAPTNLPPTVTLTPVVSSLDEDADTSSAIVVANITVNDDAIGNETLSLSGPDAGLFLIVGNQLRLIAGAALDYHSNPMLNVTVNVDDPTIPGNPDDSASHAVTINEVAPVNLPPTVTLTPLVSSLDEDADTSSPILVANIAVNDDALGNETLTLSGADAALFEIAGNQLRLIAGATLDYNTNPTLNVTVNVDDPTIPGNPDDFANHAITINEVLPVNLPPTVMLTPLVSSLDEDADTSSPIVVANIAVNDDALGNETLTLSGADAALFEIAGNQLRLIAGATLDYNTNPTLNVTVNVDDPTIPGNPDDFANHAITINEVLPVNLPPTVMLTPLVSSLDEDADTSSPIVVANITVNDDALGNETLTLSGADAALFEIAGNQLRLIAGAALDYDSNPTLDVTVNVDDPTIPGNPDDVANHAITINEVLPVNLPPTITDVIVSSSQWQEPFINAVDGEEAGSDNGLGLSLTGAGQLRVLPWTNVDKIMIQFSNDVADTFVKANITLAGVNQTDYLTDAVLSYGVDGPNIGTISLASPLENDVVFLTLSDSIADASGASLDGEWTDEVSLVSGDGTPGGSFEFHIYSLPGDVNNSGGVNFSGDLLAVLYNNDTIVTSLSEAWLDVNASGGVSMSGDLIEVYSRRDDVLPQPPAAASPPPVESETLSSSVTSLMVNSGRRKRT